MTLIIDATSTLERLTQQKAAVEGAEESKALDILQVELSQLAWPIKALATKSVVLRSEGISLSAISDLGNVIESVQKSLERFKQMPKATTLRQGKVWTSLTNRLQTLAQKAQTAQIKDWQLYFDQHLFGGLPPAKREATLAAKTPQNEKALKLYRELYQSFIKYRQQTPANTEELKQLRLLSQQLAEITFQEDVPEAVREFLDAVSGGAGLNLLTTEVLTWLHDNELMANYVVRARIN
ncbi:hypothetical protein [Pseudomonas oryzihabitans]|uniref:Uncharacterized protein n=1 Tax=Pseudomonas oryzihabitans TaxID=47885 RepID=A0ABX3IST0_9PSED|nr:hypothetical protein [Pseudomonas psychrotolerans]ONN70919.1 hypothetical protein BVL52_13090 [Pseudomonas psychrotolerans]